MVNTTQDSPASSASAEQETHGREPDSSLIVAPESKQPRADFPAADGQREVVGLASGVGLLLVAFVVFWFGLYLPNHAALQAVAASLGTFGLVWVLFRLRVFDKPYGGLIACGVVALFAAVVPFVQRGFKKLDSLAKVGLAGERADEVRQAAVQPAPVPVAPAPEPAPAAPPVEEVVRELIAPAPDPALGRLVRLKEDAQVLVGGRKFLIRTGSQFPLKSFADGNVIFLANGQEVTIAAELVAFTGQSQESPTEITKLATDELKRRYPKIFEKGSAENGVYVERTKELRVELPDLFSNPRWPLEIGEQLAAQEGWRRADRPADGAPEAPASEPSEPAEAADPLPSKASPPSDTPQVAPK